ncbi:hypothetical protein MYP14_04695 [Rhodococcus pyridinivorans]|uniref:hypothetical protein n=1 Tax=Rhodococcus pyridinivorans TaxID=103816 RepID=UPI001FFF3BBC|nr:hypothetical protein [Rhodococcus pyridinivorans]UPK64665.1 hypothetical protein MYP14_04695 [Rhodococcus pyridinivorans]
MSAPSFNAGSAYATIRPELAKDFHQRVKAMVEKKQISTTVRVDPKLGPTSEFKKKLTAAMAKTTGNVKVTPTLAGVPDFKRELKTAVAAIDQQVKITPTLGPMNAFKQELRAKSATLPNLNVGVDLDFTRARQQLATFRAQVAATPLALNVNVDTSAAVAQLMALRTLAHSIDLGSVGAGSIGGGAGRGSSRNNGGMIRQIRVQMDVDRASVARAEAELAQATSRMQQAYRQQGDAADRVRLAQQRLNDVNARANATASQRLAATQALARAQRNLADRQGDVARGLGRQADAHRRLTQAQNDQNSLSRLVRAGLAGLATSAMNAGNSLAGMVSPAGLAVGALVGLAAVSLVPLIGQLTQALGVVSLLPAAGAAAAASLATIVIGGWGIGDAFKAAAESAKATSKEAEQSAKAQRAAARQVEDAERAVGDARENAAQTAKDGARQIQQAERQVQDAQKRSKDAQEDLTRARKDALEQIEDLNLALKGSAIDEEDALIAVERARERLRDLGKDGEPVSALDVREAQNNVRGALQRLDEVRERNVDLRNETTEANKAGVEGSQQVVTAKEAVADATRAEADAQENLQHTHEQVARSNTQAQRQIEDALRRVADAQEAQVEAMDTSAESVDKFAEAMANLSPNAQDFVNKVRDMGAAWTDVRKQIQDSLFAGLGTSIQELGNTYLPTLRIGLGGIATEINGGLTRAIADLNSESTKLDWSHILENTRQAIGPFMDGISSLAGALTNIAKVGSEFLPAGAQSFAETMQRFEDWTESPEGQQKIRDFMQDSIDSMRQLKDLFVEVGRVIGGLFSTSEENGKSMLESMTEQLREWADWIRDNPDRMQQFWDDAQQTAKDMLALVGKAIELADKVAALTGNRFGLTNGKSGQVDENGNPVASDGETGVIGRTWFFPGVKEDSWFGRLLGGGGNEDGNSEGTSGGGWTGPEGGTPLSGAGLQSDLQNQLNTGNVQGGSFLGQLGDPEVWGQKWTTFSDSVSKGWNEKVWPSLQGTKDKAWEIGQGFVDDVQTKAGNAWNGLRTGVSDGWTSIQGVWQTLRTEGLGGLANDFVSKITNGSVTSWQDLPSSIMSGVGDIINTHFPGLSNGLSTLQGWFQTGVDAIGRLWDGLREKLRGPINFVIREVYNNGIAKFWNMVGPKIGLGTLDPITEIPAFATGGTVDGVMSGYSPGVDDRIIAVGGGEAVMRPEWTRAVGPDYVDAANAAARAGGVNGVRQFLGAYADGGTVMPGAQITSGIQQSMWDRIREQFPDIFLTSATRYADVGSGFDFHMGEQAIDVDGPNKQGYADWIAEAFPNALELFWDPGPNIDNGQPTGAIGGHSDHVHWAMDAPVGEVDPSFMDRVWGGIKKVGSAISNKFRNMAADLFEKPLNALGGIIPDQFEGLGDFGRIPKQLYNTVKDKLIGFVRGKATEKDGESGSSAALGDFGGNSMDYAKAIVDAAKERGLGQEGAKVGLMTALTESNLKMWANNAVPESLNYPHDAIGSDHDSVGLFQQRPGWGTVEQRMNAKASAGMFYDALSRVQGWQTMPPHVAAQAVQRSAFSDGSNYAAYAGQADQLVAQLYDAGGIIEPGKVAVNLSGKPEAVFTNDEWKMLQDFAALVGRPDFIEALQASAQGPVEQVDGYTSQGNTTLPDGTTSPYGTGAGTTGENGYTLPTGDLKKDLQSFDAQAGGSGGVRGVVSDATRKLNALLPGVKALLPAQYQHLVSDKLPDIAGMLPGEGAGASFTDANPELPWYLTADPAGSLAGRAGNLAQSQLQGWGEYFKSSWPEMLETAVGLAGVGALNGGGMTINGNVGRDCCTIR